MRKTIHSLLDQALTRSDEIAVARQRGLRITRWSYARLARTAFQFARELESRGIDKGDRVIFWGENCPEWIAAFCRVYNIRFAGAAEPQPLEPRKG